jgi:uncharacterized protein YecE (DUF72 family)
MVSQARWVSLPCLNCIELNSSFYRIPSDRLIASLNRLPDRVHIVIKASKYITHIKRLNDVEEAWGKLWTQISKLGKKMSCVLFQLPPSFNKTDINVGRIEAMKAYLPKGIDIAFEFRNKSWLEDSTYDVFKKLKWCVVGTYINKKEGTNWVGNMPPGLYMPPRTTDYNYIRIHGKKGWKGQLSQAELKKIREALAAQAVRTSYVMFNNTFFDPRSGHCMVDGEPIRYAAVCNAVEFAQEAALGKSAASKSLTMKGGASADEIRRRRRERRRLHGGAPDSSLPFGGDIQAAMRANDRAAIRAIMAARSAAPAPPPPPAEEEETEGQKCFDPAMQMEVGIDEAVAEDPSTIAFMYADGQTAMCSSRDMIKDDVLQKALVKDCLEGGGYGTTYVNLRKLGLSFSDAMVPLEQFAGMVMANPDKKRFTIQNSGIKFKYISYGLVSPAEVRAEHDVLWNYLTTDGGESIDDGRYASLSTQEQEFYDFLSAVSAAHCGHEATRWDFADMNADEVGQKGQEWLEAHPDVLTVTPHVSDRVRQLSQQIEVELASQRGAALRQIALSAPEEVSANWTPDLSALADGNEVKLAVLQRVWPDAKDALKNLMDSLGHEEIPKDAFVALLEGEASNYEEYARDRDQREFCNLVEEIFNMTEEERAEYEGPDLEEIARTEGHAVRNSVELAWDKILAIVDTGPSDDDDEDQETNWQRLFADDEVINECRRLQRTNRRLFDSDEDSISSEEDEDEELDERAELIDTIRCAIAVVIDKDGASAIEEIRSLSKISSGSDDPKLSDSLEASGDLSREQSDALLKLTDAIKTAIRETRSYENAGEDNGSVDEQTRERLAIMDRGMKIANEELFSTEVASIMSMIDGFDGQPFSSDDEAVDAIVSWAKNNWSCEQFEGSDYDTESTSSSDPYENMRASVCAAYDYLKQGSLEDRNAFLSSLLTLEKDGFITAAGEAANPGELSDSMKAVRDRIVASLAGIVEGYTRGNIDMPESITGAGVMNAFNLISQNQALQGADGKYDPNADLDAWTDAFSGIDFDYGCGDDNAQCSSLREHFISMLGGMTSDERDAYSPNDDPGEIAQLASDYTQGNEDLVNGIFTDLLDEIEQRGWDTVYEEWLDECASEDRAMVNSLDSSIEDEVDAAQDQDSEDRRIRCALVDVLLKRGVNIMESGWLMTDEQRDEIARIAGLPLGTESYEKIAQGYQRLEESVVDFGVENVMDNARIECDTPDWPSTPPGYVAPGYDGAAAYADTEPPSTPTASLDDFTPVSTPTRPRRRASDDEPPMAPPRTRARRESDDLALPADMDSIFGPDSDSESEFPQLSPPASPDYVYDSPPLSPASTIDPDRSLHLSDLEETQEGGMRKHKKGMVYTRRKHGKGKPNKRTRKTR